ncbi:MDR family MFS transporter [Apilactobacillus micheneri]|uniref:MFS transporter n=1 Tax=Apilactobacillus micheneri TaxID=1899430 RepID=A0A9Q8IP64_9LACO|nr:MDR family MFS transporter [Apilactobacillus micheneri]TPR40020.1 MFS transporter [Apilactobacillus micheneri]TPR41831.1 MFS transporter [Apilactobacillus micheneri]TPR44222.1 MFS transporter [Apilactobacillus micheneri]TPR45846.1 MFS transporter [Apilactobacillus micheneri]TPR50590.1 MFS transporter [Apilactobacillus micheneri]
MEKVTNKKRVMFIVLLGSFMALLAETLFNNALTSIMDTFKVNQSTVQWMSTGYLLIVGLMIPISSWVFQNFKTKNNYIFMIVTFLIGSLIGLFAPNFGILLTGRFIQAIATGLLMPFVQNIILLLFPPEKRGLALGITGLVIALGPTVGPTLSGIILEYFGWRDLFLTLSIISAIVLALSILFMNNINEVKKSKFDLPSVSMSFIGFGSILYAFSEIGNTGKINFTISALSIIGILFIGLFLYRQTKLSKPIINISIFKNFNFNLTTILSTLSNVAMVGMELIMPLYLQNGRMISAVLTGLIMMPGAILTGIFNPISGWIYDKIGVKKISIIGFSLLLIGTLPMIWFSSGTSLFIICCSYALRMVGISLVMMNTFTDGINSLPGEYETDGNAASSTLRQIGGSIGTALSMTLITLGINNSGSDNNLISLNSGYHLGFLLMLCIAIIGLIISIFLNNDKIGK